MGFESVPDECSRVYPKQAGFFDLQLLRDLKGEKPAVTCTYTPVDGSSHVMETNTWQDFPVAVQVYKKLITRFLLAPPESVDVSQHARVAERRVGRRVAPAQRSARRCVTQTGGCAEAAARRR
jgi:hypothetical protein